MRVAVIGVGYWGPNIVRSLLQLRQEVVIFDRCGERTRLVAREFDVPAAETVDEIWRDRSIEAVCIAVPLTEHVPLFRDACAAGKHIFIEKPLCSTTAEADALRAHVDGRTVMVGHITAFSPGLRLFRSQLATGTIGRLCGLSLSRTHLGPIYTQTDVLTEVAAHDFAVLLKMTNEWPATVTAWGVPRLGGVNADSARIVVTWPSSLIATVDVGWTSALRRRVVVAEGTTGTLVFESSLGPERVTRYRQEQAFESLARGASPKAASEMCRCEELLPPTREPLVEELATFLDSIAQKRQPETGFDFAAQVVGLLEAARTSMQQHGGEVRLNAEASA